MKNMLITIAAVVLVGCATKRQSVSAPEAKSIEPVAETAKPEPPIATAPDISIFYAAMDGNIEAVKQHITIGTDVNVKDSDGHTPLDYAIIDEHSETADLLRKHGGKSGAEDSIHIAARLGYHEAVKKNLAAGTDVNAKDGRDRTALHWAVSFGHNEIAELLITKGADVNAKARILGTPLDWATRLKHPETADLLRKHGGKTAEELKAEGK